MSLSDESVIRSLPAIKVTQWLSEWNSILTNNEGMGRPPKHFYVFSIPARQLKALSGVYHRAADENDRSGIQRPHDEKRSLEIKEYIRYGYPWSTLSAAQRSSTDFHDLRKPGWLATSILVNILSLDDKRRNKSVANSDIVTIADATSTMPKVILPNTFTGASWRPKELPPIEIIDGQHRLWAFEESELSERYEIPVVAFHGLDQSWQAYLFWTINIKPKKIGPSLAFDLYPLLRAEQWLDKAEGTAIYRETRAQELTEIMWSHPSSPWLKRINMLGQKGIKGVTQNAWVRALTSTFVKSFEGPGVRLGGLFGAPMGQQESVLQWNRAQQAAFLIYVWQTLEQAVRKCDLPWAVDLRQSNEHLSDSFDPAFSGDHTLLNTDQGVRGVLNLYNDLCYVLSSTVDFSNWTIDNIEDTVDESMSSNSISKLLNEISLKPFAVYVSEISDVLASYDWRTASAPSLSTDEKTAKLAFRGSGGYAELRAQLLRKISRADFEISGKAAYIMNKLGIDE